MWAAKSVVDDKFMLMQQVVENWFDERSKLLVCVPRPGDVRFRVERRGERAAGRRRYDHAASSAMRYVHRSYGWQQCRARCHVFGESLHQWTQIGDEAVLPDCEANELAARAGVLVFEHTDFAVLARKEAVTEFFVEGGQYRAPPGKIGRWSRSHAAILTREKV